MRNYAPFAPEIPTLEQYGLDRPAIDRSKNALRAKKQIHVHRSLEEGRMLAYDGAVFLDRNDRRKIRGEFFRGTDPRLHCEGAPPDHVQSAFDRAFQRLEYAYGARERFFVWLDPLTKRWAVWEELEPGRCEMKARFEADTKPGELASDLNDPSWEFARRRGIGERRLPTFEDFALLMELNFLENDLEATEAWLDQNEDAPIREAEASLNDRQRDVLDYYGLWVIRHDYNHGRRNYLTMSEAIPTQAPKVVEIDRGTHKVRALEGSRFAEELREEEAAKQRAALDRAEVLDRHAERDRADLLARVKAATLPVAQKGRAL